MGSWGAPDVQGGKPAKYHGLRVQTSTQGMVIPVVFGTARISGNLIWAGDYKIIARNQSSGGKGFGRYGGAKQYTYETAFALGLCEGPIAAIGKVYIDKEVYAALPADFFLFTGTYPQSPWGYLLTNHPGEDLQYPGLAYIACPRYDMGESDALPNMNFEIKGFHAVSGLQDANPADIISHVVTDTYNGMALSATLLDVADYSDWCLAADLLLSPAYISQKTLLEHIKTLLEETFSTARWHDGSTLEILPLADTAVTANGTTWTPNLTPQYDLTDDDYIAADGEDPIRVNRKSPADRFNKVVIEYLDRDNDYNIGIADPTDQASIDEYILRQDDGRQYHDICSASRAWALAQLWLQRGLYVANEYEFTISARYSRLEPGDLVTLTDSNLGLSAYPVKITRIEENENFELDITAEDFPAGVGHAAAYSREIWDGFSVNRAIDPGNTFDPIIFDPPDVLTETGSEIWIAAAGGANWGGCEVWISPDGYSYRYAGKIQGASRYGVLAADLASGADPDEVNAAQIDLSLSSATLLSGTRTDADNFITLCLAENELLAYEKAELVGVNKYDLTYLRRGLYNTTIAAHKKGTTFTRLDNNIFKYAYDKSYEGNVVYLKFPAFNIFGGATQSLADAEAYPFTLGKIASTPAVTGLTAAQTKEGFQITWTAPANYAAYIDRYEISIKPLHNPTDAALDLFWPKGSTQETSFLAHIIDWNAIRYTIRVIVVNKNGTASAPTMIDMVPGNAGTPGYTPSTALNATYTITSGIVTLTWTPPTDPQITAYDILSAATGVAVENAVLIGSVAQGVGVFSTAFSPIIARYYIRPKAGSTYLNTYATIQMEIVSAPLTVSARVVEPSIVIEWNPVVGASKYKVIVDHGFAFEYWTTGHQWVIPIPAYNTVVKVQAWTTAGTYSEYAQVNIAIAGIYKWNIVKEFDVDFTGGTFVNMEFVNGDTVERPSIKGGELVAPYFQNINDSDLWNFIDKFSALDISDLTCDVSWFRDRWWRPENSWYESPICDLGQSYTGRLIGTLTKEIVDYSQDIANLADVDISELDIPNIEQLSASEVHITAEFEISTDGVTWTAAHIDDWVTCRYIRFKMSVLEASPLVDIEVTAARLAIDVPDVSESGTEVLTGSATSKQITFTKTYLYIAPAVLTIAAGNVNAWPSAPVAGNNFTGFQLNLSSNPGTTTVYWFAKGA